MCCWVEFWGDLWVYVDRNFGVEVVLGCCCVFRGLGVVSGLDLGEERVECCWMLGGFGG